MRIDLSPQGQVVGTRRVSDSGAIIGLDDHKGKDVLILVPNGRPVLKNTLVDYVHEWEKIAQRNAKWAAKELRAIQKKVPRSPEAALKLAKEQLAWERLVDRLPGEARSRVEKQVKSARKTVKRARRWLEARVPGAAKARAPKAPKAAA